MSQSAAAKESFAPTQTLGHTFAALVGSATLALLLCSPSCIRGDFGGHDSADDDPHTDLDTDGPGTGTEPQVDAEDAFGDVEAVIHHEFGSIVAVSWEQKVPAVGWVEFSFDTGVWLSSRKRQRNAGHADDLLLGIPYDTPVHLRLVMNTGSGQVTSETLDITTEPLPVNDWLGWEILNAQQSRFDATVPYFLLSIAKEGGASGAAIIDRQARFVWIRENEASRTTMQAQPSFDGVDLLIDQGSFWSLFDGGARSKIIRIKIDGTMLDTYDTIGLHHPFTQSPDGSIIWAAVDGKNETVESLSPSGEQKTIFSCDQISGSLDGDNQCASNTIRWHEPTNTFLYSLYSHETILEIDPENSSVLRIFGHQDNAYAFVPTSAGIWWQHGGHYTQEGTLMTSSYVDDGDDELVVREYEVDDDAKVLRLIWSFGEGKGVHSEYMGEAHRLPGGNVLHNYGSPPRLREVTPEGEVVWDVAMKHTNSYWEVGRSAPLADLYAFAP